MKVDIFNTDKKYNIIYADPPWHYDFGKSSSRFVGDKYDLMKISELADLPIKAIADKDSVLLIWATFPRIDYALELIKNGVSNIKPVHFVGLRKIKNKTQIFGEWVTTQEAMQKYVYWRPKENRWIGKATLYIKSLNRQ